MLVLFWSSVTALTLFQMYSIASAFTFDMIPVYKTRIEQHFKNTLRVPIYLLATQLDKEDKREISKKEGLSVALKFQCMLGKNYFIHGIGPFSEFSAKDPGSRVDIQRALGDLIQEIQNARFVLTSTEIILHQERDTDRPNQQEESYPFAT